MDKRLSLKSMLKIPFIRIKFLKFFNEYDSLKRKIRTDYLTLLTLSHSAQTRVTGGIITVLIYRTTLYIYEHL